jgi:Tfp pilus assembly protein PilV
MAQRIALGNRNSGGRGGQGILPADRGSGGGCWEPPLAACGSATGFTLVEILVSCLFLSIAFLALLSVFGAGRCTIRKSYYVVRAASATATAMEDCRVCKFTEISKVKPDSIPELPKGYTCVIAVTSYDQVADSTGIKMVTVTTTWPGGSEAGYEGGQVVFQTLIADHDTYAP